MALARLLVRSAILGISCAPLIDAPALAQAAPGGVADPVLWVKADDPGTIAVAWRDHSPQARDVEAVGSWSVSPSDRAHNFNPFTNGFSQTRLFRDNSSFASNSLVIQSMASFAAFRRTGSTAGRLTGVSSIASAVEEPGLSITSTGMLRWYKYLQGTDSLNSSVVTPLNRSAVGSFTSNQSNKLVEVGVNGAFNSKTFAGDSATQGPFLAIGYGQWDTNGAFPGDIMEVIWYRRTITSNERDRISSYLAIKYGTTLASSYLSSSGTTIWNFAAAPSFNQNIAGIGLDQASGLHQKQANSINSGDQVIVSLGNTVAASNASNTGAFTVDRSFAIWGDNAGSTAYSNATTIGAVTYNRMARTWRLEQSGTVPQTTVAYPYSGTDNVHLIISNASDFSGTNTVIAMPTTQVIEGTAYRTTSAPISFGANTFFTFATAPPDPLLVINTNDTGAGSLRNAITFANTQSGPETVSFAIPGAGPHTITLSSALPNITANGLTIDGTTQSGTQCRDLWAGNGHDLRINVRGSSGFDGFRTSGANQSIRGLSISGFNNAVITGATSSNTVIQCNYLGLLANGTSNNNAGRGVEVFGAGVRIGGLNAGEGNVISSNSIAGIVTTSGSTDTAIRGNFIGTDLAGTAARANGAAMNHFFGAGTWRDITYNLISGNVAGINLESDDALSASADQIRIQRNRIGFNRDLSALLLNGTNTAAIHFSPGSITNVLIGGAASTEGNEIAGSRDGIVLQQVSNIRVRGNTIARSGMRGIWIENSSNVTIGGNGGTEGNAIGGNGSDGIRVLANSSGISILGNLIQPVAIAGGTFANVDHGIAIDGVSNVTIGDGTSTGRNIIGGNLRRGIQGGGTNSGITINGNYIGTDNSGNTAVANGQNEGSSRKDAISFDSGSSSNISILNNVIGGYAGALVEFFNTSVTGLTIQGNKIGVGADGMSQIVTGNIEDLIYIGGSPRNYSNVLIGGGAPGQGNTIAFSNRSGIRLQSSGSNLQVIGNTIRNNTRHGIYLISSTPAAFTGNRIFANGLRGIDLNDDDVTPNDPGDGDTGPNDLLNFPQAIKANVAGPGALRYSFTLDAPAAANGYRVEFFANGAGDPSGFGEGERFLGYVDIAHVGGVQGYTGTLTTLEPVNIGDIVAATTTRRTGTGAWDITSEFSAFATADGIAQLTVAMTSQLFDPPAGNPFFTPGKDVMLTTTVSNSGNGTTDADSIFAVISIDPANIFFNAVTPTWGGIVEFISASPGLSFDATTDLRFSSSASIPASLAECTYAPSAGYDPQVRHVCLNPKGTLPNGSPEGQFVVHLRARIN